MRYSLIENFFELLAGVWFEDQSFITDSGKDFLGQCFREINSVGYADDDELTFLILSPFKNSIQNFLFLGAKVIDLINHYNPTLF